MKNIIRAVALVLTVAMLSVTAFAAHVRPSVEQRGVPIIVPVKDLTGAPIIEIKDHTLNDKVVATAPYSDLEVVALGDISEASESVNADMTKAFKSIVDAADLTKLVPGLAKHAEDMGLATPAEELVVRDLFYLGLPEELNKELDKAENVMYLKFHMGLNYEANEQLIVMVMNDAGEWVLVPTDGVALKGENHEVRFDFVGPVAFIVG